MVYFFGVVEHEWVGDGEFLCVGDVVHVFGGDDEVVVVCVEYDVCDIVVCYLG